MPTVHLSLPEKVYRQLKERAAEMGIQVTDLIKIYITRGLTGGVASPAVGVSDEAFNKLAEKVERLEKKLASQRILLEGRYKEVEELVRYVLERIEMLEEIVESLPRTTAKVGVD